MEYVIGILLLVSFFGLVVYAVRGGNLMLGIFVMGVIWTVLPMIGNTFATNPDFITANKDAVSITWIEALEKTFQSGPEGWGATLVNVIFGAWFGRVLMNTGNRFYPDSYNDRAWRRQTGTDLYSALCRDNRMLLIYIRGRSSRSNRSYCTSHFHVPWNPEGTCNLCVYDERRRRNVCQPGTIRTVLCILP